MKRKELRRRSEKLIKQEREDEKNKVLENVIKRALLRQKLSLEEIAEDNEVSLEFVQQIKSQLEEK